MEEESCEHELEAHIAHDLASEAAAAGTLAGRGPRSVPMPSSVPRACVAAPSKPNGTSSASVAAKGKPNSVSRVSVPAQKGAAHSAHSVGKPPRVGADKGANPGVGASSQQQQVQPRKRGGRAAEGHESEGDEGEDFAVQLAHTIEQQIHAQAGCEACGVGSSMKDAQGDQGVGEQGSGSGLLEQRAAAAAVRHARMS